MGEKNVVVVGAGIFGITAALELRRRGWHVNLLDPGPIPHPKAESAVMCSMIRLDYRLDEDYMSLAETSLGGWRKWNRIWPEALFHETGMLNIRRSPMVSGGFEYESYQTLLKRGHNPVRLNSDDINKRFPAWKSGKYVDGYFNPEGGYVEGERVVSQLLQVARTEGVALHEGRSFARFLEDGSRVAGVVTSDGSEFKGEKVIITAGAWIPTILPSLAPNFRINGMPVFYLRPDNKDHFQPQLFPVFTAEISATGYYGYPIHPREGVVMIARQGRGRSVDPSGERTVTQGETDFLRFFLAETFPALLDAPIAFTNFYVYSETWDGHPWIAADPDRDGVVIATGAGHAFKFAPVLGGIIADATEGRDHPLLHKFRWRPEIRAAKN